MGINSAFKGLIMWRCFEHCNTKFSW